ncbi:hypothetical protein [Aquibium oceanicum]|uniref:Uncharacterized protein n=1 Tax=Aquibium oceanicum TaxID=1670800 RepID=A0A1L3SSR8_9HYPH|nr:hypothetical protein [Aquibium oceanicum]APH72438.1 hypothetical protein BSQ44_14525 [Aquibium oceanicum]
MSEGKYSLFIRRALVVLFALAPLHALAQDDVDIDLKLTLPGGISGYAPATGDRPLALGNMKQVTLSAQLTADLPELARGVIWRVFRPEPGDDGKLPLVADEQGGTRIISLEPGSYLVHAAFGRAGATKRITVGNDEQRENFILEAGGLKLDAVLANGMPIPPSKLKFSIYEAAEGSDGDRALIVPNVSPNSIVRLNAGVYHVVSTYGVVNAVIRSDIRVEAGKLTEATVEHKAAQLTLKLVRASGGEAIADTSWSVLTESGDVVRESVGPFASMVLAEGNYTIVAKNRDRIYQKDFEVQAGQNRDVEVITSEDGADIRSDGSERAAVE